MSHLACLIWPAGACRKCANLWLTGSLKTTKAYELSMLFNAHESILFYIIHVLENRGQVIVNFCYTPLEASSSEL